MTGEIRMALLEDSDEDEDEMGWGAVDSYAVGGVGQWSGRGGCGVSGDGVKSESGSYEEHVDRDTESDPEMEDPDDEDFRLSQTKVAKTERRQKKAVVPGRRSSSNPIGPPVQSDTTQSSVKSTSTVPQDNPATRMDVKLTTPEPTSSPTGSTAPNTKLTLVAPSYLAELKRTNATLQSLNVSLMRQKEQLVEDNRRLRVACSQTGTVPQLRVENERLRARVALLEECGIEWARRVEILGAHLKRYRGLAVQPALGASGHNHIGASRATGTGETM